MGLVYCNFTIHIDFIKFCVIMLVWANPLCVVLAVETLLKMFFSRNTVLRIH